jgi:hypothetical protein
MVARSRWKEGGHEQVSMTMGIAGHAWGLGQSVDLQAVEEGGMRQGSMNVLLVHLSQI